MKTKLLSAVLTLLSLSAFSQSAVPFYVPTNGLVAWYPFTGNTNDVSGHHHDLVNYGATLAADRCGTPNSAYYFNGDTTFLASIDTFFDNGWQNYTVSLWLNTDTTSNPYNFNHSQTMFNTEPHYGSELSLSWGGGTSKYDYFYTTTPTLFGSWDVFGNNAALSNSLATTHTWHHVSIVKADTIYKLYIDGLLDNTFHNPATAVSYLCQVYIGTISDFDPETFWGYLDDYGIWDRALSDAEEWQLFNNGCTTLPSCVPSSGLVAWYPFNNSTLDESGNNHHLINSNAVPTTDRCGNANSAFRFDGVTGTHLMSIDQFFDNGWPNFSISLWYNSDTIVNPYSANYNQCMFNTYPHYGTEISYNWGGVNDKYNFFYNTNPGLSGSWDVFGNNTNSNQSVMSNQWGHLAMVKNNSTYTLYLNGVQDKVFQNSASALSYMCQIEIGNISGINAPETFYGSLDDYGIWNRSLSSAEVLQLYHACCTQTSVKETASANNISIYPNPVNNMLYVKTSDRSLAGASYTMTDEVGRVVLTGRLDTDGQQTIDIRSLATAMYFLKVGGDKSLIYKIVKQ